MHSNNSEDTKLVYIFIAIYLNVKDLTVEYVTFPYII